MGLVQLFRCHCKFNSNPSGTNIYERREHTVVENTGGSTLGSGSGTVPHLACPGTVASCMCTLVYM